MNKGEIEELIKKYEAGSSTLSEEQYLFDNDENIETATKTWFRFINLNKRKAPHNLHESVWEAIQAKRIKKHRLLMGITSAAASIIVLISLLIYNQSRKEHQYNEKRAMLSEALNMFENTAPKSHIEKNIIYEDELIIIYSSSK